MFPWKILFHQQCQSAKWYIFLCEALGRTQLLAAFSTPSFTNGNIHFDLSKHQTDE